MHIIITGTSKGIGLELLEQLASDPSHKVIAISRNTAPLERFSKLENVSVLQADMAETTDLDKIAVEAGFFFNGKVDILINNAGLLIKKPFEKFNEEDFDQMFSINVKGVFLLIRKLLAMFSNTSHVVNIGSMGGYQGSQKFTGLSLYAASKGALTILSECLAEELKPRGICFNTLALGAVNTEMLTSAFPGYNAPVNAHDMAGFIAHFALTGHHFFNGKTLPVSLSTP